MDAVIAYWQGLGVDGFLVDMAHGAAGVLEVVNFSCKAKTGDVFFCAEAYNDDPAGVRSRDPSFSKSDGVAPLPLLDAGFDAVYDDSGYDTVEASDGGRCMGE